MITLWAAVICVFNRLLSCLFLILSLSMSLFVIPQRPLFSHPTGLSLDGVRVGGWQPCRFAHYTASEPAEIYRNDKSSLEGNNDHMPRSRRRKGGRSRACVWTVGLSVISCRQVSYRNRFAQ